MVKRDPDPGRPPALVIRLELEQGALARLEAETQEDEMRLRHWLRRSGRLQRLPAGIVLYLDHLEARVRAA
jgi:hypothetical protein